MFIHLFSVACEAVDLHIKIPKDVEKMRCIWVRHPIYCINILEKNVQLTTLVH